MKYEFMLNRGVESWFGMLGVMALSIFATRIVGRSALFTGGFVLLGIVALEIRQLFIQQDDGSGNTP